MKVLALDAAMARCAAAIVSAGIVIAERRQDGARGHAAVLAGLVADVLRMAGAGVHALDGVCVTVGPGSFTGLRAALALAQGLAMGAGVPLAGVSVAEALADSLPNLGGRTLWTAIDSRRGRVFLDIGGSLGAFALDALPAGRGRIAVCGDAAPYVAARLAARGDDVMLTDARLSLPRHVAIVGVRRLRGEIAPLAAQPLYVDPPEAKPPPGGLRPGPMA